MRVIIPCGEKVENENPRWMVSNRSNHSMLEYTISRLPCAREEIVAVFHQKQSNLKCASIILNQVTFNQPETIAETIKQTKLQGDFFVKDLDSSFDFQLQSEDHNYLCVESLHSFRQINCNNKSYVVQDHNQNIIDIKEGVVVSDLFSTGGYYFTDAQEYLDYYHQLTKHSFPWSSSIYLSDILALMILDGKVVQAKKVSNYLDYGDVGSFRDIE